MGRCAPVLSKPFVKPRSSGFEAVHKGQRRAWLEIELGGWPEPEFNPSDAIDVGLGQL